MFEEAVNININYSILTYNPPISYKKKQIVQDNNVKN